MIDLAPKHRMWIYWIVGTLLVELVFGFFHLMIPLWGNFDKSLYSPLVLNQRSPSFTFDETIYYATKARESLDGHYLINDPFVWEYKNKPSGYNPGEALPAFLMARLSGVSGGVDKGFILADFIFPGIVWFSFSFFLFLLTKKPFLSSAGGLFTMIFSHYLTYFPYLPSIIKIIFKTLESGGYSDSIRSFHPQVTLPILMIFIIIMWQMVKFNKKKWFWLGLSLSALFYSYVFLWTFCLAWIGITSVWALKTKKIALFKNIAKGLGLGIVLALPYLINLWKFSQSNLVESFIKNAESPVDKLRLFSSGDIKQISILGLIFISSYFLVRDKKFKTFWQLFSLSGIGVVLGLRFSGIKAEDILDHWGMRIFWPMTLMFFISVILKRLNKDSRMIGIIMMLLLLTYQSRIQWIYFKDRAQVFTLEQTKIEMFEWLNQNTQRDSVVATTSLTDNLYLPVYTHNNVVIPRGFLSIVPAEESLERFLMVYKVAGIDANRVSEMFSLTESNKALRARRRFEFEDCAGHHLFFRRYVANDYYNCSVPKEKLKDIMNTYNSIDKDLSKWQKKYRVDYWLWGPNEEKWAQMNPVDLKWQLVWQNQDYKLFKLL